MNNEFYTVVLSASKETLIRKSHYDWIKKPSDAQSGRKQPQRAENRYFLPQQKVTILPFRKYIILIQTH